MLSLRNLQRNFASSVIAASAAGHSLPVAADGISPLGRLRVYHNNFHTTMCSAMQACYPVVQRLVGDDYFGVLVRRYVGAHPSVTGNLQDYGARFSCFLDEIEELRTLPYLADVARLEWFMQEAYRAAEPRRLNLDALADVPPYRYGELRFNLHPAARLLCSSYPLMRIWQVNQAGYTGNDQVSLEEGGDLLLVIRRDFEIEIERLSPGEFTLLCQIEQGRNMHYACETALANDPAMNVAAVLRSHVTRNTLTGFHH